MKKESGTDNIQNIDVGKGLLSFNETIRRLSDFNIAVKDVNGKFRSFSEIINDMMRFWTHGTEISKNKFSKEYTEADTIEKSDMLLEQNEILDAFLNEFKQKEVC